MTSRLSRAEKMETHVLGSRVQNLFFSSDEVERWSGVGHAHGVRNQCTSDAIFSKKKNSFFFASARVRSLVSEGRTVHASRWVQNFVSVCLVLWCAWDFGGSGSVQLT